MAILSDIKYQWSQITLTLIMLDHPPTMDFKNLPFPIVWINGKSDRCNNISCVRSDINHGMEMAVRYLWEFGHRDIRFISLEGLYYEKTKLISRWEQFLIVMSELGISHPESPSIFFSEQLDTDQSKLAEAIRQAVNQGCTALIVVNALHTLKVHHALHTLNLRVPDDVSVLDWEFSGVSPYLMPPRTTLSANFSELAKAAVDMLTEMVQKKSSPDDRLIPMILIKRESVGVPRVVPVANEP